MTQKQMRKNTIDVEEIKLFAESSAKWWDESGPFAPLHKMTPVRMAFLREELGDVKGLSVLDIGCGGGLIAEPLTRLGARVTGIDADETAIAVAAQHAQNTGLSINYIHGAAEDLVAKGKSFDVVLALEVIEHVNDPVDFVSLCAALVKPGGKIVFSTLNRTWKSYLIGILMAERVVQWVPHGTHDWKKFIKPSELAALCAREHLHVCSAKGLAFNPLGGTFYVAPHDLDVNYFLVTRKPSAR